MRTKDGIHYSLIIPARDEAQSLGMLLAKIRDINLEAEVIVVNDGSCDKTQEIAIKSGAKVINHPYPMGNGAAIKSGVRAAKGHTLIFMDADGQHDPDDIGALLEELSHGYDMVVGARTRLMQASLLRSAANYLYNKISSWIVGHTIKDLTSGFRVANAGKFKEFLHLLPNGFSYPTTSTMAFFRSGYPVSYIPINVRKRKGKSHIRLLRDGMRFLIIIFRIGTLYSPLKMFIPISAILFLLGIMRYIYTYTMDGRFTNMSALLMAFSVIVFMIGLVSEQITQLMYKSSCSKSTNIASTTETQDP